MSSAKSETKCLILAFVAYFMFYYNRKCVTLVFPQLIKEGLTQQNAGTIVSSQSISMALVTFTAGILSDRFPAKHLLCLGLTVCGISTLMFSLATNVKQFAVLWFINGLGQGFSLPSLLKITKDNSQPTSFATNWSLVLISVNIAGVINPFISAFIAQHYHWRTCLAISALLTLTVSCVCYLSLGSASNARTISPQKNIDLNRNSSAKTDQMKASDIWRYPMLWMCVICRFIVAVTRISVSDWSQLYLINEREIDVYLTSTFVSFIEIGGIFGKLIAGRVSDWLMKRAIKNNNFGSSAKMMARIPVSVAMLGLNAVALHLYCFHISNSSSWLMLVTTALLIGVNTSGNVVNLSVIATEISPERSGLCSSLVNLSAKVGGIFTGLPLSLIADRFSWNCAFVLIEILCLFSVGFQLFVTRVSNKSKIE